MGSSKKPIAPPFPVRTQLRKIKSLSRPACTVVRVCLLACDPRTPPPHPLTLKGVDGIHQHARNTLKSVLEEALLRRIRRDYAHRPPLLLGEGRGEVFDSGSDEGNLGDGEDEGRGDGEE